MAATMASIRRNEFKRLYFRDVGNFNSKYAALYGLLGMNRISLRTRRWVTDRIREMQSMFTGEAEHLRRLDELVQRNDAAKERFERRIEKQRKEKDKKKGWKFGRPPGYVKKADRPKPEVVPAPELPKPMTRPEDIWAAGIAEFEKERKRKLEKEQKQEQIPDEVKHEQPNQEGA
jgi:hypothetical protein